MKKMFILFVFILAVALLGCEKKDEYTIEDFYNAVNVFVGEEGNYGGEGYFYENGELVWKYYSTHIIALSASSYLRMAKYTMKYNKEVHNNVELYDYLELEPSEDTIYIIVSYEDGNSKAWIPAEKELIQIYADYLVEYVPPMTEPTTTCVCG